MSKYVCPICGYVYDEAMGDAKGGIAPGTRWEDVPENWVCPLCRAPKSDFGPQQAKQEAAPVETGHVDELRQLTAMEASILCSNLARGCEKQYKPEEQSLFAQLAAFFRQSAEAESGPSYDRLLADVEQDISVHIPHANAVAAAAKDRGALRALVWNEKVSRMLKSLLSRYQREGEKMLENTGVWVCTICGFVYIGNEPPELCPVCKVPPWKFEKIEENEGGQTA